MKLNEYINYAFYDENKTFIAIINKNTPIEIINALKTKYDEIRYKE